MNFTLHTLLENVKDIGGIDYCLDDFINLFFDEIFGKLSEEKE